MVSKNLIDNVTPDIRSLHDLAEVLYDRELTRAADNFGVYYMYRGLAANEKDRQMMIDNELRYDVTIIPPKMLGVEFPKTYGHEHALVPETEGMTYAEIYEVLEGEAYYLLQKQKVGSIEDLYIVHAKQGEKCVVPPNYGHVTINASGRELKMANWVERNFKSNYSIFEARHGAGYYAISSDPALRADSPIDWIKNKNYRGVPELKSYQARDFNKLLKQFKIDPGEPMYNLVNNIKNLDFLKNPQKYKWI
ncbi:MAG: glucose-6-phosphate isomerase [Candidatus Portnoybacteria bacterium]|nr:glucose-6-phosphate isomerase [Candidatus Portnoybacteria bacterium]